MMMQMLHNGSQTSCIVHHTDTRDLGNAFTISLICSLLRSDSMLHHPYTPFLAIFLGGDRGQRVGQCAF